MSEPSVQQATTVALLGDAGSMGASRTVMPNGPLGPRRLVSSPSSSDFQRLAAELDGALHFDATMRTLYATDASVYREMPQAVALPKTEEDIRKLVRLRARAWHFADTKNGRNVAGRASRRSGNRGRCFAPLQLAFSRLTPRRGRVRVQPGVVRNELNLALAPHGIFFAPETSTQNRCMIGGMVGNNACGANSVVYGSTREHLISARAVLSDGSIAEFGPLSPEEFEAKCSGDTLEASVYRETKTAWRCRRIARRSRASSRKDRSTAAIPATQSTCLPDCAPFTPGRPAVQLLPTRLPAPRGRSRF